MAATSSCWGPTSRASAHGSVAAALNPFGPPHLLVAQFIGMPVVQDPSASRHPRIHYRQSECAGVVRDANSSRTCVGSAPLAASHCGFLSLECFGSPSAAPEAAEAGPQCVGQGAAVGVGLCWWRTSPSLGCTSACCCNLHAAPPSLSLDVRQTPRPVLLDSIVMVAELLRGQWAAAKLWSPGGGGCGQDFSDRRACR